MSCFDDVCSARKQKNKIPKPASTRYVRVVLATSGGKVRVNCHLLRIVGVWTNQMAGNGDVSHRWHAVLAHFFTGLENLPSSPFLLGCTGNGNKEVVLGTGGGGREKFEYRMGIQLSAAAAKKFRKLSRSPIWGF